MPNEPYHILVVDDEPTVCDLLCDVLNRDDFVCTSASDGSHALEAIAKHSFDLTLLDIKLPDISGIDLLREIRLHYSNTAVVMITGLSDIDEVKKALKLGASDYIVKPFDTSVVITSVHNILDNPLTQVHISEMDAIAEGVESREDYSGRWLRRINDKTIEIARRLSIPERDSELDSE